jgi:formamidopyrimidine-DNA glycosylase
MPELPEVEHAAGVVRRALKGRSVVEAIATATRVFRGGDRKTFAKDLRGQPFSKVERRGKWMLIEFDKAAIASHLGMTGAWIRLAKGDALPSHVRATLVLDDESRLVYRDPRLFGRLVVGERKDLETALAIDELGPDPLHDGVDAKKLFAAFAKTSRPVRVVLLDQTVLAGVGNILATEALFFAKIDPARAAKSITEKETRVIAKGVEKAVKRGIERFDGKYLHEGSHVKNPFVVYDRAGEPCPRCKTLFVKQTIGGRTSTACPNCQR